MKRIVILLFCLFSISIANAALITTPDVVNGGTPLADTDFNQILDAIKDGTKEVNTSGLQLAGTAISQASQAEMEAGSSTVIKWMTPQGVFQAIAAWMSIGHALILDYAAGFDPSATDYKLGYDSTSNTLRMGDEDGASYKTWAPLDDTATNGDTMKVWSADKVYDQLVLKLSDLVGDTSPQLGADLDLNTYEIPIKAEDFLPIAWAIDGGTAPDAIETITSTNKVKVRKFSGTATQDVFIPWEVPFDWVSGNVTFQVVYFVTESTTPASNEGVYFTLAGASIGDSDLLGATLGTAVGIEDVLGTGYAQYDRAQTALSGAVTITDIAAGETVMLKLSRVHDNAADDYAQKVGVYGIKVRYSKEFTND